MADWMTGLIGGATLINLLLLGILVLRRNGNSQQEWRNTATMLEHSLNRLETRLQDEAVKSRAEAAQAARNLRQEIAGSVNQFNESILQRLHENTNTHLAQLQTFSTQLERLTQTNEQRLEQLRQTMGQQLELMRQENGQRLESMRATVDEKLHATLEKRLGESFQLVSERLEIVHKGLGEMQTLASGVGDLKRVLSNVKTRGIWGEIQLGNLIEQILTPEQYAQNVATRPGSQERVEFAIKLPGKENGAAPVWLPIDAKFPQEDFQRLLDAQELGNYEVAEEAAKALEQRVKSEAKDIAQKYIAVPYTTEFGILFLPIEGLYAEVLRRPGLTETLLRDYRIVIAGPTTLAALLNSLQLGFRTLAIERRSSEVWELLGAVKTEFGKFGDILDKTQKKLQEASNSIDTAARKSRTIERKLREVQALPSEQTRAMLETAATSQEE